MCRTKLTVFDIILIALLALIAAVMLFLPWILPKGDTVVIKTDKETLEYPLGTDRELEVESKGHTLHIVIQNGEVFVESSDCRDRVCVNSGKVSSRGQTIVCAPAEVVITIGGEGESDYVAG